MSYAGDGLVVGDTFQSTVAQQVGRNGHLAPLLRRAELADGIQRHLGALLVDMLGDVVVLVIGSEGKGLSRLVSETFAGTTWSVNSRERRLSPWSNDALLDSPC